jgi:hypothetical protein
MLLGLFEDLEQQAEGLALSERDIEVAELSRAEYAQVAIAARVHASVGREVVLGVEGLGAISGKLARVGAEWCLVAADDEAPTGPAQEWIVRLGAVQRAAGLSDRALDEPSRPLAARLGLGSALRGVAAERSEVRAHLRDGAVLRGHLGRVGADFLEIAVDNGGGSWHGQTGRLRRELVPFRGLAALRRS